MKCPDCNTQMIREDMYCVYTGKYIPIEKPYWKCLKCKIEIDEDND